MAATDRVRRVQERIHVIVAELLRSRVKDERLGFVTVTEVRVTGDLQHAQIFYTAMGDEAARADTAAALEAARGGVRTQVNRVLGLRLAPTIEFVADAVPESAAHIEALLREAHERDEELSSRSAGARYAGDADPYRKPDEEE